MPTGILAQDEGDSTKEYNFSEEELTQILAPIALYPDELVAQILMASTYPLEVVEADRWRRLNSQVKGTDLDNALQKKSWDPSIKSLCHFPDILNSLSEKLDQTRKLGDAFLGQEEEVMATIQELRSKARAQGTLNTTDQQKVIVEDDIVRIEPANPEVIYVPVYDPAYVYGPWWYPAYPPYYWYYPPGFYNGAYISFGPGIHFGLNAFSWARFDWPVYRIHVDINRPRSFNQFHGSRNDFGNVWTHDPQHRRGVAYRNLRTSERFGSRVPSQSSPYIPEKRGYPSGRIETQNNVRPSQASPQRDVRQSGPQTPQARKTPASGSAFPEIHRNGSATHRVQSIPDSTQKPFIRDTPFRGIGEGSFERRAGERGSISNRSNSMRQQSGGFSGDRMQQGQGGGRPSGREGSTGSGQRGNSRRERQ
jgi:hypothetical protein